jgi:hypothetical protein
MRESVSIANSQEQNLLHSALQRGEQNSQQLSIVQQRIAQISNISNDQSNVVTDNTEALQRWLAPFMLQEKERKERRSSAIGINGINISKLQNQNLNTNVNNNNQQANMQQKRLSIGTNASSVLTPSDV